MRKKCVSRSLVAGRQEFNMFLKIINYTFQYYLQFEIQIKTKNKNKNKGMIKLLYTILYVKTKTNYLEIYCTEKVNKTNSINILFNL